MFHHFQSAWIAHSSVETRDCDSKACYFNNRLSFVVVIIIFFVDHPYTINTSICGLLYPVKNLDSVGITGIRIFYFCFEYLCFPDLLTQAHDIILLIIKIYRRPYT